MATKAEQRREAIIEFLTANPGSHAIDQIATGCAMRVSDTARAIDQLGRDGAVADAAPEADGNPRWALAAQGETTDEPASEDSTAAAEANDTEFAEDDGAASGAEEAAVATESGSEPVTSAPAESDTATEPTMQEEATAVEDTAVTDTGGTGAATEVSGPDPAAENTSTGGEAPVAEDATERDGGESDPAEEAAPEVDPDPAVLLLSAQLAFCQGPVELEAITKAAFKVTGPKQVETALYALCALAEHGAVECSAPYAPDDRGRDDKASWTVAVDAAELDRIAAVAQLADAPAVRACPTCHTELAMPRPKGTGRKASGSNERGDGRRRLADGELRGMLQTLIGENPGEELKPSDFARELKNDPRFADRISANPSGAIRSALIALERAENGAWVTEIEDRTPLTYRCREEQ